MEIWINRLLIAALLVLAGGIFFALLRAIRGPRVADRIMGVNMIGTMTTACIAILSVLLDQRWLLDVALIYCMISFLAVVVLVRSHIAENRKEGRDG
jgi:multicomponent Na+:H+ antiporter subunit F